MRLFFRYNKHENGGKTSFSVTVILITQQQEFNEVSLLYKTNYAPYFEQPLSFCFLELFLNKKYIHI